MDKYESYRQELIKGFLTRELEGFDLIEQIIEQCIKIDLLADKLEELKVKQ